MDLPQRHFTGGSSSDDPESGISGGDRFPVFLEDGYLAGDNAGIGGLLPAFLQIPLSVGSDLWCFQSGLHLPSGDRQRKMCQLRQLSESLSDGYQDQSDAQQSGLYPLSQVCQRLSDRGYRFYLEYSPQEENSPNPEVTKTTLLAILTIIAGLATMVSTFKYNLDGVLVYHFSGLTSGRGVLAYMLVTLFKGIVSFFMIITGYKLFINRNDENAVHRFREQTRMILKFMIIIVIAGIASLFADLSLLSVMFNAILICPFPIIGLPLLASAASSTDKLVQGKGSAVLWWIVFVLLAVVTSYIAYISTVIILAG